MRLCRNLLQTQPLIEQTTSQLVVLPLRELIRKFELHGVRQSELSAQSDQSIHHQTDHEIDQAAPIQKKSLVPKCLRKVRNQREIVDRITQ